MPLIRLRGISRRYESKRGPAVDALRAIDLEIEQGEFVAIIGPSGGGKTTLMNILGLLDDPTSGEYVLDNHPIRASDRRHATKMRAQTIGFVFQAFHLLEGRPASDSVELNLMYRGVSRRSRSESARAALEVVGLGDRAHQSTSLLSGGQRQRVAIARAVAADAKLILADEPTGNLDSRNATLILDELERLNGEGATVVVVTHSSEVAARAHRVINIVDGQLVSDTVQSRPHSPAAQGAPTLDDTDTRSRADDDNPDEFEQILRSRESTVSASCDTLFQQPKRMRLLDMLRDAWASVLSRRFQTLGQCLAVAIAVALTITTIGLSLSARAQVSATFDAHLNREVTASWSYGIPHSPDVAEIPRLASQLHGVDAAAALLEIDPTTVATFADARQIRPHVAIGDIISAARLTVAEAPWHQGSLKSNEVYVGDLLAKQLQLAPLASGPSVRINNIDFVVAGLITESSRLPLLRGEVVVGAPLAPGVGEPTDVNVLLVTAAGAAQQVARQLPAALNPFQPDQIAVNAPTDSKQLRGQIEQGVQATLAAFTLLALVVAIAALMNATLLAVNARRGEIGMRKALGARDRQIGALITIESAYVGLLGGALGLVLGMLAILSVTITQRWSPVFDLALAPLALAIGLVVGAGGGGIASIRAARLNPADNLRT